MAGFFATHDTDSIQCFFFHQKWQVSRHFFIEKNILKILSFLAGFYFWPKNLEKIIMFCHERRVVFEIFIEKRHWKSHHFLVGYFVVGHIQKNTSKLFSPAADRSVQNAPKFFLPATSSLCKQQRPMLWWCVPQEGFKQRVTYTGILVIWSKKTIRKHHPANISKKIEFYSERSEAEGRAERGIGLVKKKNEQKKKDDDDYDDDDDDQFCTRSNILPFFFSNFHTYVPSFHSKKYLWSLLRTNSLQKTSWLNLLWEKKIFLKKNSKIFFEKKKKNIFFEKKIRIFFFLFEFFFFQKNIFEFFFFFFFRKNVFWL